jgi:DNA repair photolyase
MTKQSASKTKENSASATTELYRNNFESSPITRRSESERPIRLTDITFDPTAIELTTSWFSGRRYAVTLNAYPNGVTLSTHRNPAHPKNEHARRDAVEKESQTKTFHPSQFHLRTKETRDYLLPQGRYHLIKDQFADSLELHLKQLREQGILEESVLYFGVTTDGFHGLQKKMEVTMKCLELIEKYQPGLLVVASRSPLILAALPTLKHLGERAVAVISVESPSDNVIQKYMPGQSRIIERFVAADGLRAQGVKVNLQVSPILPYGDFYRDAWPFAELLADHADYITLGCLATGSVQDEHSLRSNALAMRLSADKHYRWLRPHAYKYLFHALQMIASDKLVLPVRVEGVRSQLSLFAA